MELEQLAKEYEQIASKVEVQGAHVRKLKAEKAHQHVVLEEVGKLKELKEALQKIEAEMKAKGEKGFDRGAFEELMKKRFFFAPSFQIYGGVSGLFDYGPPGCAVQSNMLDFWRKFFVLEEDMLELDCSILTPYEVLKTSGHVDKFADLMCKDLKTGDIFRVDHLVKWELEKRMDDDEIARSTVKKGDAKPLDDKVKEAYQFTLAQIDGYNADELSDIIKKFEIKSPNGNDVSQPEVFNLMFGTPIGPTGVLKGFLRPETAQGQFVNFKRLLEFNNDRMPFASAQVGRSFRNEISPRSGLLRVREFTMAEIEHFVHPEKKDHARFHEVQDVPLRLLPNSVQMQGKSEIVLMAAGEAVSQGLINNQTLAYFMVRIQQFLLKIGIKPDKLRFRQHLKHEMAHYACDCWDAEIQNSYGWIECVGCADRSAFDLTRHSERTKERLVAREALKEPKTIEKLKATIDKKALGITFKKNAKIVEGAILSMNEDELVDLKQKLSTGKASLAADGQTFEVPESLLKIEKVTETIHVIEYVPSVIEPSFGIGRILYSLMEHVWWIREGSETRHVLSFPPPIAPIKCLLVPLSNNSEFQPAVKDIASKLRRLGVSMKIDDSSAAIGRRYARADEIGIAFGITVDFQTVQDQTVTLRERDSTVQVRAKIDVVIQTLKDLCEGQTTWSEVEKKLPIVES